MAKWGVLASVLIVAFFGALFYFSLRGVPDEPTSATRGDALEKRTLPEDLPALFEAKEPDAQAAPRYEAVLRFARRNRQTLRSPKPPKEVLRTLTEKLLAAKNATGVPNGFLDDRLPLKPGRAWDPAFGPALGVATGAALKYGQRRAERVHKDEARDAARAVFAMGKRLFQNSTRLYLRRNGLKTMQRALGRLGRWGKDIEKLPEKVNKWRAALREIDGAWREKLRIVRSLNPHVGDLIHIAREDKDRTFRIAALLQLGIAKFNPGSVANKRVLEEALKRAVESSDPLIAKAARAAQDFTKKELKAL